MGSLYRGCSVCFLKKSRLIEHTLQQKWGELFVLFCFVVSVLALAAKTKDEQDIVSSQGVPICQKTVAI